jgi:hypothetical protein
MARLFESPIKYIDEDEEGCRDDNHMQENRLIISEKLLTASITKNDLNEREMESPEKSRDINSLKAPLRKNLSPDSASIYLVCNPLVEQMSSLENSFIKQRESQLDMLTKSNTGTDIDKLDDLNEKEEEKSEAKIYAIEAIRAIEAALAATDQIDKLKIDEIVEAQFAKNDHHALIKETPSSAVEAATMTLDQVYNQKALAAAAKLCMFSIDLNTPHSDSMSSLMKKRSDVRLKHNHSEFTPLLIANAAKIYPVELSKINENLKSNDLTRELNVLIDENESNKSSDGTNKQTAVDMHLIRKCLDFSELEIDESAGADRRQQTEDKAPNCIQHVLVILKSFANSVCVYVLPSRFSTADSNNQGKTKT